MKLGAFSISLAVKNLAVSRDFYERLGFAVAGGVAEQNWLVMRNADEVTIGLFQGMFPRNMLTFNPGWGRSATPLDSFEDVRAVQHQLEANGLKLDSRADPATKGPASLVLTDPDGNPILIDQHR
jgi:lactoylglutathione lyase